MTELEIEKLVVKLFNAQEGVCPLTGVSMTLNGDSALFPSLDRIDSLGNYEPTNLQLVCRFANFWKGAEENAKFKKLIALVKSA